MLWYILNEDRTECNDDKGVKVEVTYLTLMTDFSGDFNKYYSLSKRFAILCWGNKSKEGVEVCDG